MKQLIDERWVILFWTCLKSLLVFSAALLSTLITLAKGLSISKPPSNSGVNVNPFIIPGTLFK